MQLKEAVIQLKNEVTTTKQIRGDVKEIIKKGVSVNNLVAV